MAAINCLPRTSLAQLTPDRNRVIGVAQLGVILQRGDDERRADDLAPVGPVVLVGLTIDA